MEKIDNFADKKHRTSRGVFVFNMVDFSFNLCHVDNLTFIFYFYSSIIKMLKQKII